MNNEIPSDMNAYFTKILKLGPNVKIKSICQANGAIKLQIEGEVEIPWGCVRMKHRKDFTKRIAMQG